MPAVDTPRTIPIHQALLQPLLLLGAERELVIVAAVTTAMLVFTLANAYFAVAGAILWILSVAALQRLAKIDEQMSRVYVRHVRYGRYYPATAHLGAPPREPKRFG